MDGPADSPSALAAAIRPLWGKLRRRFREQAGTGDLTPSQTAVVLRLDLEGAATTSALARAEGMRPQSMAAIVAALEAAGVIEGKPDPADGRQTLLSLTDESRRGLAERRAARQDWLSRTIEARLSAQERATLAAAVRLLNRIVKD
jgi:DNA-binding MarR family transcriptional regulator